MNCSLLFHRLAAELKHDAVLRRCAILLYREISTAGIFLIFIRVFGPGNIVLLVVGGVVIRFAICKGLFIS